MTETAKKFKFVCPESGKYKAKLQCGYWIVTDEDGRYYTYPNDNDPTNYINTVERIYKKPKAERKLKRELKFPIIYRNTAWLPEERMMLIRGSKGMVSVFESGGFEADCWTDYEVREFIKDGTWVVESVGNKSVVDYNGEE